jgi:hypothetical protein
LKDWMSLYLEISVCNRMVYLTFPFSSFITQSIILPITLFLLANIIGGGSLSRGTYATLYIL